MSRVRTPTLVLTVLLPLAACVDGRTEIASPEADAPPPTTAAQQPAPAGLDAEFADLAREIPGFGGAYRDRTGRTVVHMAGRDLSTEGDRIRERLRSRVGEVGRRDGNGPMASSRTESIVLRDVTFDYLELVDFRGRAAPAVPQRELVYTDIDERTNRVTIGITRSADEGAIRGKLERRGIPSDAVTFEVTEPATPLRATSLTDRVRPMAGGLQLLFPHSTPGFVSICTMGFNVVGDFPVSGSARGSSPAYFLTNSHCSSTQGAVDGTPYYQQEVAAPDARDLVGREVADPALFSCFGGIFRCRWSDASVAMYESRGAPTRSGVVYRPESVNTSSVDLGPGRFFRIAPPDGPPPLPMMGDVLSKVGRTTGWTEGEVARTCVHVLAAGTDIVMLCQDLVLAGVGAGDSGAPVFMQVGDSRDVIPYGVLWGGTTGGFFFSSLFNIAVDFGSFSVN